MKSRVHPTYKTHYRVGNWRVYERALVSRGDVTLWLSPDARAAWGVPPSGRPGGQQRFSDLAIETALTLRLVFRLPLRQTEGFVRSILTVMRAGLDAPDHTTLSRRSQLLDVAVHNIPATGPLHLIVDSTGLSVVGEGEWAAAKHGGRGTRGWKKLHLGVDRSGVIVAHALTEATVDDATVGIDLIGAAAGDVASVTADAAYDTVAFYEAASARHAQVVVPPTAWQVGVVPIPLGDEPWVGGVHVQLEPCTNAPELPWCRCWERPHGDFPLSILARPVRQRLRVRSLRKLRRGLRVHRKGRCGKPGAEVRLVPAMEMSSTGYGCFFTPGGGVVSMSLSACRDTTRQFALSQRMT